MLARVAAASSGTRCAAPVSAPAFVASPDSIGALELWISPGPSGSPGARSSSPVHRTATRGLAPTGDGGRPRRPSPRRARPPRRRVPASSTTASARMSSPAPRTFSPDGGGALGLDRRAVERDVLLGDHGGRPSRDRRAGRDPDRFAVADFEPRGRAGTGFADHLEHPARIPGQHRVAVHRRARKRRHVAGGAHVGREHTAQRGVDLHLLGRQQMEGFQNELAGSCDRDQRRRHPCSPFSICAASSRTRDTRRRCCEAHPAGGARDRSPTRRSSALLARSEDLAKGWLLALLEQAPLGDAQRILAADSEHRGTASVRGGRARDRR